MKNIKAERKIANLFKHISHPARIRILIAIGDGESCVCHLEAALGYRQAYISQQLMELRKAKILMTSREGRYIFYHLNNVQLLEIIRTTAIVLGINLKDFENLSSPNVISHCCCPKCSTIHNSSNISEDFILLERKKCLQ